MHWWISHKITSPLYWKLGSRSTQFTEGINSSLHGKANQLTPSTFLLENCNPSLHGKANQLIPSTFLLENCNHYLIMYPWERVSRPKRNRKKKRKKLLNCTVCCTMSKYNIRYDASWLWLSSVFVLRRMILLPIWVRCWSRRSWRTRMWWGSCKGISKSGWRVFN